MSSVNQKYCKDEKGNTYSPITSTESVYGSNGQHLEMGDPVAYHNNVYRGKNLTNVYTLDQISAKVKAGTFDDLYIGDYITKSINGTNRDFRIAGFDLYYNKGDTACTTHHIVMIPDTNLGTAHMNATNITTNGYTGSEMYKTTLPTQLGYIKAAFGSTHILKYRQLFTVSVNSSGQSNNWQWFDCELSLMSEVNVYGTTVFSSSGYDTGIDNMQFPIFRLNPNMINKGRSWYWLKCVRNASDFCYVNYGGYSSALSASNVGGIRPLFLIY